MINEFSEFDSVNYDAKSLLSALPEKYNLDYMVYTSSSSIKEEDFIWRMDFKTVVKRTMFKRFDNWVETEFYKAEKNNAN
uniref:Uncharacterized protein n=1 Tax=viral metagenome TaxID=1070528 RepID=A0A6H1ZTE2_9ZZZZ